MKIELYDFDYKKEGAANQMVRILTELKQYEVAQDNVEEVTRKTFTLVQAFVGFLITLGVDLEEANGEYMEKMIRKYG